MKNDAAFNPLNKTKLYEEIVEQFKTKILNRNLMPDEKLPTERKMAEIFNVNRSTIRSAMNKLESIELIEIKHGDGVYVKDFMESGNLELIESILFRTDSPDPNILVDLQTLRRLVVPEIAYHAALKRSEDDLSVLEQIILHSDDLSIDQKDMMVHNTIAKASRNIIFVIILNSSNKLTKAYSHLYFQDKENCDRSEKFHLDILKAIKNRQPDEAKRIMHDVLVFTEEQVKKAIESEFGKTISGEKV